MEHAHLEGVDPLKPFYLQKLEEIHLLERPFLNVDCAHMKQIDQTMLQQLFAYPQEVIPIFDIAVNELFFTIYENDTLPHQIQVRPYNVDIFRSMRSLDPEGTYRGWFDFRQRQVFDGLFVLWVDIDKLVTLTGMVIRSSLIMPEMRSAYFSCNVCGFHVQVEIDRGRIIEPTVCQSCNTAHSFDLIHNRSLFADKQYIKLQETPGEGRIAH